MTETVLIIDDDIQLLQALSSRLERAGYLVTTVATEAELHAITLTEVQHILLDLKFREISGLGLIKPLKQRLNPQNIVILTGCSTGASAAAAFKAGATNYLEKPIQTHRLLQCLAVSAYNRKL